MTVATLNTSSGPFTANGATTVFPFTFSASSVGEVQVLVNSAVVTVGFDISLNADQSSNPGGSVTFTAAPVNGAIILIASNPNFQQLISFKDSGPFLQSTLDIALDRIARLCLYLKDKLSRAVVFPLGEAVSALPAKASRLNKYLGFDANGDFAVLVGTTGDTALRTQLAAGNGYTLIGGLTRVITPQQYGAVADGVTNDGPAFAAAIAALKAYALNGGNINAYKGSPKLFVPAGDYYLGTTTLDINHTLIIEGEGSGRAPAPAYGCTHLRWADGVCGIRTQFVLTSGTTTVDGVSHDGAGSVYLRGFTMQGGYVATNSASHAIVARTITYLDDVLIRQWSGTGVLTWTGNVNGTAYSGNTSVSRYTGVKVEGCKVGFDTRGTDSNVITFINCEGYQCRQAGFIDDNGAGSNTYIGCHATYNGLIGGSGVITQVSNSGHYYAVKWGQEGGAAVNAPTGTTDDNTWWDYAGSGGADSAHPAWVSGMSGLTSGGDYVMLSNFPTVLINSYVEGGGFSQLNVGTLVLGGTNLALSSQGGSCLVPEYDGLALKRLHAGAVIHLDGAGNAAGGFDVREGGTNWVGGGYFSSTTADHYAGATNGHKFHTIVANVATYRGSWNQYGIALPAGELFYINSLQVVGPRDTGWTADTGIAKKTANATYAAGTTLTYSATYVQAEQTAMATRMAAVEAALQNATQTIKAIKDERLAAGSIGA